MRLKLFIHAVLFATMLLSAAPVSTALAVPSAATASAGRHGMRAGDMLRRAGSTTRGIGRWVGRQFSALGRQAMRPVRAVARGVANVRQRGSERNLQRAITMESQAAGFEHESATLHPQADHLQAHGQASIDNGRARIAAARSSASWLSRNVFGRIGLSSAGRAAAREVRIGRREVRAGRVTVREASRVRRDATSAGTVATNLRARAERRFDRAIRQEQSANRLRAFGEAGRARTAGAADRRAPEIDHHAAYAASASTRTTAGRTSTAGIDHHAAYAASTRATAGRTSTARLGSNASTAHDDPSGSRYGYGAHDGQDHSNDVGLDSMLDD